MCVQFVVVKCTRLLQDTESVRVQPVAGLGAAVQTGRVTPSEGRRARHARQAPSLQLGHLAAGSSGTASHCGHALLSLQLQRSFPHVCVGPFWPEKTPGALNQLE